MSSFWFPVIIAVCTAAQVPGMVSGHLWSYTSFVFCLLMFIASVATNMRNRP